jgi:alpha-ketoglutarate-dependent taurine dioxygenase
VPANVSAALDQALTEGWAWTELSSVRGCASRLAAAFQDSCQLRASRGNGSAVDRLNPTRTEAAKPRSLSARFGAGGFPLHTDGAYVRQPPRLLVLYCVQDTEQRPTRLLRWDEADWSAELLSRLRRETYWFRNGRHSFLDSVVSPGRSFVRFDAGCMIPATRLASATLAELMERLSTRLCLELQWRPGMTLIIDNWRMLHGRGTAAFTGSRTLLRLQLDLKGTKQ